MLCNFIALLAPLFRILLVLILLVLLLIRLLILLLIGLALLRLLLRTLLWRVLLRCLIVRVRLTGALRIRSRRLIVRNLSSALRLLTRVALLSALLPSLLGRPLSTRVVDRDSVVLVQRWLVDTPLVARLLRR
ncbi:hypothetical protein AWB96_10765 [Mycobacteroides chelonae]|nr:hypothetical protein AWB96_10765 [Mycobacteroides chelonae]